MKRSMKLWTLVLPLAASFAPLEPAAGQDPQFTFTVPVELLSMVPEVTSVRVGCKIYENAPGPGWYNSSPAAGYNAVEVPVSPGQDFVSEVTVPVNVDAGRNPSDIKSYGCAVASLINASGESSPPNVSNRPWTVIKPGTSSVLWHNRGTIP